VKRKLFKRMGVVKMRGHLLTMELCLELSQHHWKVDR